MENTFLNTLESKLVNKNVILNLCAIGLFLLCLLSIISTLIEIKEIESGLHYTYDSLAQKDLSELRVLKLTKHKVCFKNSLSSVKSILYLEYVKIALIIILLVIIKLRSTKN